MKNLIAYDKICFSIHEDAVNKKEDDGLQKRLKAIEPLVKKEYVTFENEFITNTLSNIKANKVLKSSKDDLLTLYGYSTKTIRDLRKYIKDANLNTISSTCQNCTVDTIGSMDHVLPQSRFPEFVVHPQNLFPSCTTCNSKKSIAIAGDGNQTFLNLYLDTLPQDQYLFAIISLDKDNELSFEFKLNNDKKLIDESFYKILENHYLKLNLLNRMKDKGLEFLTAFKNDIKNFSKSLPYVVVAKIQMISIDENLIAYGYNHWYYILQKTLLESALFKDHIQELIKKENLNNLIKSF